MRRVRLSRGPWIIETLHIDQFPNFDSVVANFFYSISTRGDQFGVRGGGGVACEQSG